MMARDAAHDTFLHTVTTLADWLKTDPALPVPTGQTTIWVRVHDNDTVTEFATAQGLDTPTHVSAGWLYVDVPFDALIYRVASGGF
jgi:hypothetical protein